MKDEELKEKDNVIKRLTQENLTQKQRLTQIEQLLCCQEDKESLIQELRTALQSLSTQKDNMKVDYETCSNKMLEVEEKCQETQKMCMKLLKQCKIKDDELLNLNKIIEDLEKRVDDELFIYRPLKDDVVDEGLAKYINKAPLKLRQNMEFEREAPGVYKYHRKKVFMKIENETIVIRVGGGFLTIDEFVDLYCKGEKKGERNERITNLVYGGKCAGSSQFKTFFFEHKDIDGE